MSFIKNIDIAKEYRVSPTAVNKWLKSAKEDKNKLDLITYNSKDYVKDTISNRLILEELSQRSRGFNRREEKTTALVQDEFYKLFDEQQIIEIVHQLQNKSQIPHKYTYFNGGAKFWDNYAKRGFEENIANTVTNTAEMLEDVTRFITKQFDRQTKLNVIDIGVGNAYPVQAFLQTLKRENLINRYIALDFSQDILNIAENNINNWFNKSIPFKGYIKDITCDKFHNVLFRESQGQQANIVNLVLFLGSTIENLPDWKGTLSNIVSNLGRNDFLLLGQTLTSKSARLFFDLGVNSENAQIKHKNDFYADWQELMIPNLLGLQLEDYKIETRYDDASDCRIMWLIPDKEIEIKFNSPSLATTINLNKGEKIIIWKHQHHSVDEISTTLAQLGLQLLLATTSKDQAQVLTISRLKD